MSLFPLVGAVIHHVREAMVIGILVIASFSIVVGLRTQYRSPGDFGNGTHSFVATFTLLPPTPAQRIQTGASAVSLRIP